MRENSPEKALPSHISFPPSSFPQNYNMIIVTHSVRPGRDFLSFFLFLPQEPLIKYPVQIQLHPGRMKRGVNENYTTFE